MTASSGKIVRARPGTPTAFTALRTLFLKSARSPGTPGAVRCCVFSRARMGLFTVSSTCQSMSFDGSGRLRDQIKPDNGWVKFTICWDKNCRYDKYLIYIILLFEVLIYRAELATSAPACLTDLLYKMGAIVSYHVRQWGVHVASAVFLSLNY